MGMLLGNPIVGKELTSALRSRRALALTLTYVAVLALLVLMMWPAGGINPGGGLRARGIFATIVLAQLAMLLFFAPAFSSTSITTERASGTYELLVCSHLNPPAIVLGKLAGAVGFLLLLIVLGLPAGAMCLVLGGVELRAFFLAYVILAVSGVLFGLAGVALSALLRRSFLSLILTYALLLLICGAVQLPMLLAPKWVAGQATMHAVRCASPFTAALAVTQNAFRPMGPSADRAAVVRFFVFAVVASAVLLGLGILGASRLVLRPSRSRRKVIGRDTALWLRAVRRVLFLIDPRRRRFHIPLLLNPFFVLELRTSAASVSTMLRALFGCVIFGGVLVLLLAGGVGPQSMDVIRLIAVSMQFGLIGLLAPSLTVGAISSEVENKTLDLLRTTPAGPVSLLIGKMSAAIGYGVMLLVAVTPVFLALMYIREKWDPAELTAVVSVAAATIFLAIAAGLFFSSLCRKTATAAALTYGLTALLVVGTALGALLAGRLHPALARAVVAFNPVIAVVARISGKMLQEYYDIWQTNVGLLCGLSALALIGGAVRLWVLVEPTK